MTAVLTYHQLTDERSPLSISPELFSEHLAVLAAAGVDVVTAAELAAVRRSGDVPERAVVLTFDDGFAAAVAAARPRLAAANMRATFFCVAGHIGGRSDWASRLSDAPVAGLATLDALATLAADGHEIGSHGWSHAPLDDAAEPRREIEASKALLTELTRSEVATFAYPYGARPSTKALELVAQHYEAAFGTSAGRVEASDDMFALPRIDAHYVRDPRVLRRVVLGVFDGYLRARRMTAHARRTLKKDYAPRLVGAAR